MIASDTCVRMNPCLRKLNYWQPQLKTVVILEYNMYMTEQMIIIGTLIDIVTLSQRMQRYICAFTSLLIQLYCL